MLNYFMLGMVAVSAFFFAYAANFFRRLWHKDFYFRWLTTFFTLLTLLFIWAAFQEGGRIIAANDVSLVPPAPASLFFAGAFLVAGISLVWSLRKSNNNG